MQDVCWVGQDEAKSSEQYVCKKCGLTQKYSGEERRGEGKSDDQKGEEEQENLMDDKARRAERAEPSASRTARQDRGAHRTGRDELDET